jgi:regulator of protease activity HflC (stomatin/prohibitin superfamily)
MSSEIPSWGRVTAKPHECLIVLRHGAIHSVQQGGSVFKWPSDAVARVDTSVRRLQFTADQVTREKTGVAVTGLAVFRVVRPELAYRMLDLQNPDAIADILREMFVGATRRLVANLTLEDCMTRRKDALASELMAEVAPVVEGQGRESDTTDAGWGVAIDTIEVQDVRVLSEEVFDRLQAPYREQLALSALHAEDEVRRERAQLQRAAEEAREDGRRAMIAREEARLQAERERAVAEARHEDAVARQRALDLAERARIEAEGQVNRERLVTEARIERDRLLAAASVEVAELEAQATRARGETEAAMVRMLREARDTISEARLQELALTEALPRVAEAFADSFEHAVVTGGDLGFLSAGVGQVLATLKAFDVQLPGGGEAE